MTRQPDPPGPGHRREGPDGPLLAVCQGTRCRALWRLAGTEGLFKATVANTTGGLLIAADCLGPCHLGAVAVIARRHGNTGNGGSSLWLSGVEQAPRGEALQCWIAAGGPAATQNPMATVPAALSEAVIAQGPRLAAPKHTNRA